MMLVLSAFTTLVALALCAYRAALGPQIQLARLGLGLGVVGICSFGLAYPAEASPLMFVGYGALAGLLGCAALMAVTSLLHWWRTADVQA